MNDTELYTLAEYDDAGDRLRVMSDETIQVETSPGNWHWEHHARVSEYQLAKQIHSGPSVDDLHEVARKLHKAEKRAEDAVKAMKDLVEIVTDLMDTPGYVPDRRLAYWRDAITTGEAVIENAKPQDETETCCCGREYRAADGKLIPPKLDEIPVCPACFDEWEESTMY